MIIQVLLGCVVLLTLMLLGLLGIEGREKGRKKHFYRVCRGIQKRGELGEYAFCILDIEEFKYINKAYGEQEGDNLLRSIEYVLRRIVGRHEGFTQVEADVYKIVLKQVGLDRRLAKIIEDLEGYRQGSVKIRPKIGVYKLGEEGSEKVASTHASIALKTIKGTDQKIGYYSSQVTERVMIERGLLQGFERGLLEKEFKVYYQGKYNLKTKEMIGAEALVRWEREGQVISPMKFIGLFESSGDIEKLDMYVLGEVCKDIRRWGERRGVPVIAINLSRRTLMREGVVGEIVKTVLKQGVRPEDLEIEVTESYFFEEQDVLEEVLRGLKQVGFQISLDDFGVGYSALTMLKNANLDVLKIDKGFLAGDHLDLHTKKLLRGVVYLGQSMDLKVIAEGVETLEQEDYLIGIGCDYAQGYLYGKPISVVEFEGQMGMG